MDAKPFVDEKSQKRFSQIVEENGIRKYGDDLDRLYSYFLDENKEFQEIVPEQLYSEIFAQELVKVVRGFPENYKFLSPDGRVNFYIEEIGKEELQKIFSFLNFFCFQKYICEKLQQYPYLPEMNCPVQVRRSSWTNGLSINLEIAFLADQDLCTVFCTMFGKKDRQLCKAKGYEQILCTKEMGGEKSKAVLVTRLSIEGARNLQKELEIFHKNILVLAGEDLRGNQLCLKISKFLDSNKKI